MATLVSFHAHPDDEAILVAGTLAKAASAGHRVVLVVATRGEEGEVAPGVLAPGESLAKRRVEETLAAADILGVSRVEFLGYRDSGMRGLATNSAQNSFWSADVDDAAAKLAAILVEEAAEVLTIYDDHGGYNHPDHVKVHDVGSRAAVLANTPRVYEATMNRDFMVAGTELMRSAGVDIPDVDPEFGVAEDRISTTVDVSEFVDRKRAAMAAHASQIGPESFFLAMSPEIFALAFGNEWFVRHDRALAAGTETSLFADV